MKEKFEYSIFIPTLDNDSHPFSESQLTGLKKLLIEKFGGLTDTKHKNKGVWKIGGIKYKDEIVIWKVLAKASSRSDYVMTKLKRKFEKSLKQKEILIVKASVQAL